MTSKPNKEKEAKNFECHYVVSADLLTTPAFARDFLDKFLKKPVDKSMEYFYSKFGHAAIS